MPDPPPLSQREAEMLAVVGDDWVTSPELGKLARVSNASATPRLTLLWKLGLIERRGIGAFGSPYEWRRAKR